MITFTAMLVGVVIFAMISNVYCLWCNIAERRMWRNKMEQKEQELKRCKMELEVALRGLKC